jgi:hypothetical protein
MEKNNLMDNIKSNFKVKYPKNLLLTRFSPLKEVLELGKTCDKSGHCCKYGGGYVLDNDLEIMAKHLQISIDELKEKYLDEKLTFNTKHFMIKSNKNGKPYGPCVFLKDNLCSIHEHKPLHCRVGSCCHSSGEQLSIWFALNHFVNIDDPESIRQWASYLKTHPTVPGGELHSLVPDKEKLKKILGHEIK